MDFRHSRKTLPVIPAQAGIHNGATGAARRGLLIERRLNLRLGKRLGFKQSSENCFIFFGAINVDPGMHSHAGAWERGKIKPRLAGP